MSVLAFAGELARRRSLRTSTRLGRSRRCADGCANAASIANTALNASQKRIGEYDPDQSANRGNDQANCIGPWSSQ
jgi:hypothetical protein